jgi:PAS domain S-box-containing protein
MAESIVESSTETVLNVARTGTIKVLHVDDDQAFVKVAKQCLDTQGEFEVNTASSVNEALEKLKKTDYDVIVSDYQMPGKDGLEFLKELREKGNTGPFIVFTGKGREEVAIKALNLGADLYVDKHGDPETVYHELAHAMRQAVDRKSAQIELLKREAKLHAILESSPEAITVIDLNGTIIDCNQATLDVHGYTSKSEVIGQHSFNLVSEKDHKRALEDMKRTLEQGSTNNMEYTATKKDGSEFHVEISGSVIRDLSGNPTSFVSITKDITERKKTESVLKESEERYRDLVEREKDIIYSLDDKGKITFANPAVGTILGYRREETIGKDFMVLISKELQEKTAADFNNLLKTGEITAETVLLDKKGHPHSVEYSSTVIKDGNKVVGTRGIVRDVTQRKKAEREIRIKDAALASSISAVAFTDLEGNLTYVNNSFLKIWGYANDKEVLGRPAAEFWLSEENAVERARVLKALKDGEGWVWELTAKKKDGSTFEAQLSASLVKDETGKPLCMMGSFLDITERKRMEEGLKKSEERLRSIVENSSDQIFMLDRDCRFLSVNRAAADLFRMSSQEMIGRSMSEVFPETIAVQFSKNIKNVFDTGKSMHIDEKMVVEGRELYSSTSLNPVRDDSGRMIAVTGIVRDITEGKKTEKMLQESEERFRAIFEGANDGILAADAKTRRFSFANPRICEITGYSSEELLKLGVGDINPKKDLPYVIDSFEKQRQGKAALSKDIPVLRKDERVVYCDVSSKPIKIGSQEYLVGFFRDVTEHRKAEEERREVMEKLQMMNEKLRVVGGLTRHDVNNKLAAITGNAYLARKKLAGNSEVLDYLKQIEASVKQTVQIFDFARAYEMLGVEELVHVDVEKSVNEAISLFSDLKDIKVINDCHGLTVLADSLLRQLFYNLIDNSLKYGEKLSWTRVYYEDKNDHLNLTYEDDGVGIPQAAKPKLFGEGYTTGKGSGYGLFLVKRMMEVYGWTIQETGTQGTGAQFTISIPRTNKEGKENYRLS